MDMVDYLTAEEKQQIEGLMQKAAERRKKSKGETSEEVSFLYFQCRAENGKKADETVQRADYEDDLENVLEQVCGFCQKYKFCDSRKKCGEYLPEDEELPFG